MEAQLRQSQRMEAIGSLTGGVAHDFNNLLTVMMGNLDLLVSENSDRPQTVQQANIILDAALRGAELTKQMLTFSRRQALNPKCVDLNVLAENTIRLLTRTLGEGIRIDLQKSPDECHILVDEAQLEAALLNITINARDAMPDGGILTVTTDKVILGDRDAVQHPGLAPGEHVVLKIVDTGVGMSSEVTARIFEPFFTTKGLGMGTGLGLSMVYGFVKQSGGYISVNSAPGEGATFELFFPVVAAAASHLDSSATSGDGSVPELAGAVVLAVDDQPAVRATAVAHLTALGYQVVEADSAKAALEELAARARIDFLFTDIVMPGGINGIELARLARAVRPNLKVLYTSGFPCERHGENLETNVDGVLLTKPYRRQDLKNAMAQVLAAA